MLKNMREENLAKLAAVYAGLVFGIYWIPIRALENAGFTGLWSTTMFNLATLIIAFPFIVVHRHRLFPGRFRLHLIGFGAGLGYALYAAAYVYTDVINVIILFYLMPIWGFLLARIFMADPITPVRFWSMIVGFGGLWVILGEGFAFPIPQNLGDWMALVAGFMWAGFAMLLLLDNAEKAVVYGASFVTWAFVLTAAAAWLFTASGNAPAPDIAALGSTMAWLMPFAFIVIFPAAVATVYAPTKLNPGIVGLLFMAEVSVGTITAAIWAGEDFGLRQLIGVCLITVAGALETAWVFWIRNSTTRPAR